MPAIQAEAELLRVEQALQALGDALAAGDAERLLTVATSLQQLLAEVTGAGARQAVPLPAAALPAALHSRLLQAQARLRAQREALARASAALARRADALLPERAARVGYDAGGQTGRRTTSGFARA